MMYAKRVKRKCGVRGCKCLDSFAISRTREGGNSIIICKDCLVDAVKAVEEVQKTPVVKRELKEAPPLFFHSTPKAVVEEPAPAEPEKVETPAEVKEEPAGFVCPQCGKVCKTEQGLQKHIELVHKEVK